MVNVGSVLYCCTAAPVVQGDKEPPELWYRYIIPKNSLEINAFPKFSLESTFCTISGGAF